MESRICREGGKPILAECRVDVKEFEHICYGCYKLKPKHVCVDFDGVLAQYAGWKGPNHLGDPRPGAKEFLEEIRDLGMKPIILTTREPENVYLWLSKWGLKGLVARVTQEKPPALVYIDDRALRFRGNFQETLGELQRFVPFWREG